MVVPYREEMAKRHLKVTGDLGRVVFMVWMSQICVLRNNDLPGLRNTTCATPNPSKRVFVTPTLSTTLSVVNIPPSEPKSEIQRYTQQPLMSLETLPTRMFT